MVAWQVISLAHSMGNQPLSPSRSRSPSYQPADESRDLLRQPGDGPGPRTAGPPPTCPQLVWPPTEARRGQRGKASRQNERHPEVGRHRGQLASPTLQAAVLPRGSQRPGGSPGEAGDARLCQAGPLTVADPLVDENHVGHLQGQLVGLLGGERPNDFHLGQRCDREGDTLSAAGTAVHLKAQAETLPQTPRSPRGLPRCPSPRSQQPNKEPRARPESTQQPLCVGKPRPDTGCAPARLQDTCPPAAQTGRRRSAAPPEC